MDFEVLERILGGREKPTNLSFTLLKNITENFSDDREIGHGGFATVYKGVLPNGNVAVKRIRNGYTINETFFYREVDSLLNIEHKNVVRFLGFCASRDQIAIPIGGSKEHIYAEVLCFEYISNGSVQKYITDELRGLEWNTRYEIIRGICEGLHHLHKEKQMYHMDLKPENILLDNDMVPKITDVGLSRLDEKSKAMSEDCHGSLRYCAPEYLHRGKMSFKSDIYSLGIIIMELVTGEKAIPKNNNNVLRRWRHRWRKSGEETPLSYQQVTKCIEIGLLCLEKDPSKRPYIWDIILPPSQNINPYSEDDMLGIEPLELQFPFELDKEISSSLMLTNEMGSYIAFNIKITSPLPYCTEPNKGIVPPRSKCNVKITLQPQEKAPENMQQAYAFILRSTKVKDGLAVEDISADIFEEKGGNMVDEVNLDVVFEAQLQSKPFEVHKLDLSFPFEPDNSTIKVLTQDILKAITCDFSSNSELGRGGYGVVYKGVFPSGETIAVKKLFEIHLLRDDQFWDEVSHLAGIKHRNLVQTLGYCAETSWDLIPQPTGKPIWAERPKRLICFEYVRNKSLDKYISDESLGLEWNLRYEIIEGICKGLQFLHEECHIVHLDLKPENILMDASMAPKIADFGLSKIFGDQQTRLVIKDKREGSIGYMAPEYILHGIASLKADIFSFGVIIIQIVTGCREYPLSSAYFKLFNVKHCPKSTETSFKKFTKKVVGSWEKIFASTPKYKPMEKYTQQVKQCITVALSCVDVDMDKRPTAKDIIQVFTRVDQHVCLDDESAELAISSLRLGDNQDG